MPIVINGTEVPQSEVSELTGGNYASNDAEIHDRNDESYRFNNDKDDYEHDPERLRFACCLPGRIRPLGGVDNRVERDTNENQGDECE